MISKLKTPVGQTWRLKCGLLYAGISKQIQCILTSEDNAQIFDSRDNAEIKSKFYGAILNCKFEVKPCVS